MPSVVTIPFTLSRATMTLYKADAAGNPILEQAVWIGARTEGLEVDGEIAMVESTPSGAAYLEREQLGEAHQIRLDRIWAVNPAGAGDGRDFVLARGKYVMVVYWEHGRSGQYQNRTYYWVTAEQVSLRSNGQTFFGQRQVFGARYYIDGNGVIPKGQGSGTIPVTPANGDSTGTSLGNETPCLFTHLGVAKAGDYFLGTYQFSDRAVQVSWVKAIGKASQTTNTVLGLEKNGVMTGLTLTLVAGTAGSEASASATPALNLLAGDVLRWKVVSGPAPVEEMAYSISINMNVK
jgi:hypothetical protein